MLLCILLRLSSDLLCHIHPDCIGAPVRGTGDAFEKKTQARRSGQHDIDYSQAKNLQDKWNADAKMVKAINHLPGKKTWTEAIVKSIMQAKQKLKL